MNNDDERNFEEERAVQREHEREMYEELGFEHAQTGRTRRQAQQWLKRCATVQQERDYWRGYAAGETAIVA